MRTQQIAVWVAMGTTTMMLAGCHVETDKHGDGDNVRISTPFGGMQVKTNDAAVAEGIGLPVYPGAQVVKKDKDSGAADVNMNFGSFHLQVKAASYRTDDAPDKVETFYRGEMKKFGDVIACRDDRAVGTPARTFEGLTCENQKQGHIMVQDDPSKHKLELKTGSEQHQHIVEIDGTGDGTKIGLVALDLPGKITSDDAGGQGVQ